MFDQHLRDVALEVIQVYRCSTATGTEKKSKALLRLLILDLVSVRWIFLLALKELTGDLTESG